jgi:hypothetical protein
MGPFFSRSNLKIRTLERFTYINTVEPGYNEIGQCHTSSPSDILWYQLIPLLTITLYSSVITTLVYNDTKYSVPFMAL